MSKKQLKSFDSTEFEKMNKVFEKINTAFVVAMKAVTMFTIVHKQKLINKRLNTDHSFYHFLFKKGVNDTTVDIAGMYAKAKLNALIDKLS